MISKEILPALAPLSEEVDKSMANEHDELPKEFDAIEKHLDEHGTPPELEKQTRAKFGISYADGIRAFNWIARGGARGNTR